MEFVLENPQLVSDDTGYVRAASDAEYQGWDLDATDVQEGTASAPPRPTLDLDGGGSRLCIAGTAELSGCMAHGDHVRRRGRGA